ncbi:MAG: flagellar basal-body rod protein FlgF [Deltaproteobacteria bacterium]|nr:flagellar basal-body rod protein FlgF [Deltaproteobacteria bacterium]
MQVANTLVIAMINANLGALFGKRYLETKMDIIANNLANTNTAGYKNLKIFFNYSVQEERETEKSCLPDLGALDTYIDFSNGPLVETRNPLDIAIEGDGFFVIMTPRGPAYTRAGQFTLSPEKRLTTLDGMPVMGEGGEIYIDGKDVRVETDGSVFVDGNYVDRLRIVDFENKSSLKPDGKGLFVNMDQKNVETSPERITVKQGFIEGSNVNVVKELTEMIFLLRAFETYTKVEQMQSESKSKLLETMRF